MNTVTLRPRECWHRCLKISVDASYSHQRSTPINLLSTWIPTILISPPVPKLRGTGSSPPLTGQPAVLDETASHSQTTCFSIGQDFYAPLSPQASASEYHSIVAHPSYSFLGQDVPGISQAPRMPRTNSARLFRPPVGSGSSRNPSLSSHPYHHARLCHMADRASAQQQEAFLAFPASTPASSMVVPYDAMTCDRASASCYSPSQSPPVAKKVAPPTPTCTSTSHSDFLTQNTAEIMSLPMGSHAAPEHMFLSIYQPPPSPPHTPADQADIEFAQYRYGGKRCFYRCRFDLLGSPCNQWIVGDRTRVLRHLRNHHHLQTGPAAPARCRWEECTHSRPMKQENLSRHVVMHLGVKWKCPHCRRLFSRDDAVHRHIERMVPGMDVTDAEVVPGREARAISEPQFKRAHTA